jgi:hypothetical protein
VTWLTEDELAALAGDQPDTLSWRVETQLRWKHWRDWRAQVAEDPSSYKHIEGQLGHRLGHHPTTWKVVGITKSALETLGGADGMFTCKRPPGIQRGHLHPWRDVKKHLMTCDPGLGYQEFTRYIWSHDVTVLCLALENAELEDRAYFEEHTVRFINPFGELFSDVGKDFKYGKKERECLRLVKANLV